MSVKPMYTALLLLALPMVLTIFFGFSWIQYREAKHLQQTNPAAESAGRLKFWKIMWIVSGVLFGGVLLIELTLIAMMCMAILFS